MNHSACKATLLGLGLLAAASSANAQTADRKTAIGVHGIATQYRGDLGNAFWKWKQMPYGGGIDISRYIGRALDLKLDLDFTRLRYPQTKSDFDAAREQRFKTQMYSAGLGFKIKAPFGDKFFAHPYILLEPSFSWVLDNRYAANSTRNNFTRYGAFNGQAAAGLDFLLGQGAALYLQIGQNYVVTPDSRLDGASDSRTGFWDKHDRYMQFQAGLRANLGKAKDTDGDGVPDRKDKCPDTPTGVKVDVNGCPFDTDGDGVADYQDKCPDVKGLQALQGCPDADGDGVADGDDKCPNTPAGVKVDASGCPLDSDGDGVADYLDKCPNTPAGAKVDANGCVVDSDGDGVPDNEDRCPDHAGPASNKGCPEIKAEQKKILNEATRYINFDYNKATLKPTSYKRLDAMVAILNEYPDYSLSIAGHTDSKGSESYNLRLSYERAASARKYMVEHGIAAERIESRGYGASKPIADNKTAVGQAQNRRVDFDPYLTGEPNAAEVKYGPAPSIAELKAVGEKLPGSKTTGTGARSSRKAPLKKAPVRKAPAKRK